MDFHGLPVLFNPLATATKPVREHKPGRHPAAYHARVQKKWTRRFGTKQVPTFYLFGQRQIVCHPALREKLLAAFQKDSTP